MGLSKTVNPILCARTTFLRRMFGKLKLKVPLPKYSVLVWREKTMWKLRQCVTITKLRLFSLRKIRKPLGTSDNYPLTNQHRRTQSNAPIRI